MKRRRNEPEMMGAAEAAKTLGVLQTNLRVVAGLPEPYQKIKSTTLWRAKEIRELAIARGIRRTDAGEDEGHTEQEARVA